MPIYPETSTIYCCVICGQQKPPRWQSPQHKDRPPVCWNCEQSFGTGTYGDANPDRRTIKQISALISAIEIDAYRIKIGEGPLYA